MVPPVTASASFPHVQAAPPALCLTPGHGCRRRNAVATSVSTTSRTRILPHVPSLAGKVAIVTGAGRGKGRVLTTSSPAGVFGKVRQANYGAATAAIAGFTLIAAQELKRYGVTVNCLAPNARTRMTESAFELPGDAGGCDPLDPASRSA